MDLRTTPSGHSSISFAGLFYLTLFLLGQSQANNGKTSSWRTMISFIPWLMACYIALVELKIIDIISLMFCRELFRFNHCHLAIFPIIPLVWW